LRYFDGVVKAKKANADGTLRLEALNYSYQQMIAEVDSYSFDPSDSDYNTWEKVIVDILSIYTKLETTKISIKDESGTAIPSWTLVWNKSTVMTMIIDIVRQTNAFLLLNEYGIPVTYTYINAPYAEVTIERGINLSENNIINDVTMRANSVSAYVNYNASGSLIIKRDSNLQFTQIAGGTFDKYFCCDFIIPTGCTEITKYEVFMREDGAVGANFECVLLYNAANQGNTAPNYVGNQLANSLKTVAPAGVPATEGWVEIPVSPAVNVSAYQGQKVWFAVKKVGASVNIQYEVFFTTEQGQYINTETNGNFTTGSPSIYSSYFRSHAIKIFGTYQLTASGSAQDDSSIEDVGVFHRNLVSKSARTNNACNEFASYAVSYLKDGLKVGNVVAPFERIYPGTKLIIYDPENGINYDNLFIKGISLSDSMMRVDVTETGVEFTEAEEDTVKSLKNSDNMLLG
jgi:hypothetical protein